MALAHVLASPPGAPIARPNPEPDPFSSARTPLASTRCCADSGSQDTLRVLRDKFHHTPDELGETSKQLGVVGRIVTPTESISVIVAEYRFNALASSLRPFRNGAVQRIDHRIGTSNPRR
jgi:hypothetical protein